MLIDDSDIKKSNLFKFINSEFFKLKKIKLSNFITKRKNKIKNINI